MLPAMDLQGKTELCGMNQFPKLVEQMVQDVPQQAPGLHLQTT